MLKECRPRFLFSSFYTQFIQMQNKESNPLVVFFASPAATVVAKLEKPSAQTMSNGT